MTTPALPNNWTQDHSIALILLIVSAVDGVIDTIELHEVDRRLSQVDPSHDVSVHVAQDAYEYLLKASQLVDDDAKLISVIADHCARIADSTSREVKDAVLKSILTVTQADGWTAPEEVAAYKVASEAWGLA